MNLKWIGIMITTVVLVIGVGAAWGTTTTELAAVKLQTTHIEQTLDVHIKENYIMHEKLTEKINLHDVMLMEQKVILLNIDKNLVILSKDVKRMVREGK